MNYTCASELVNEVVNGAFRAAGGFAAHGAAKRAAEPFSARAGAERRPIYGSASRTGEHARKRRHAASALRRRKVSEAGSSWLAARRSARKRRTGRGGLPPRAVRAKGSGGASAKGRASSGEGQDCRRLNSFSRSAFSSVTAQGLPWGQKSGDSVRSHCRMRCMASSGVRCCPARMAVAQA